MCRKRAALSRNASAGSESTGTDIALFNGLFTYVVDQGWQDKDFIAKYTKDFDAAVQANKLSLDEASKITGVPVAKLKQAADWAYKPKTSGHRPHAMHVYEKGIIWGNDNYLIQSALVRHRFRVDPV